MSIMVDDAHTYALLILGQQATTIVCRKTQHCLCSGARHMDA
jgi:hypothetical protein